ncbi:hypothetical protein HYG81_20475 (plasmid) [Natrinema zhouii]|uniref:hypothetical protein n=1 Tax=Natrinema zhouii TaxID=1710539 RepID=UPI001CFFEDCA|nr:hypothetical protein [Natrinema zhouii]UHQ98003.1 hypothetical protein HYG81_20475 [Natrinema zhouii]
MHSSAELDDESFDYVQNGRSIRRADVMPSIDAHSRLGVVERRQFDALGATAFIYSRVRAFYDLYRQDRISTASVVADTIDEDTRVANYLEENGFYAYPDFYTFQATAELVDYLWFDIWPDHKQVHVGTDSETTLRAINDRAITTLLVPNGSPSPSSLAPETRESAERRIENCYLYSPDGDLDDPDVSVQIETDSLEEWIETTFDTVDTDPDSVRDECIQYWRDRLANQPLEQDFKRIDLDRALHYLPDSDR